MAATVNITIEVDESKLYAVNAAICNDPAIKYEAHNLLAKMCDPYVPFLEGILAGSGIANVTENGVTYNTPYAAYQYYLHDMAEDLAGTTNRTREYHPLATSYWDKAMMLQKGDLFRQQLAEIIARKLKEK